MEAINILALWGVPKEILLLGAGGFVIVVGAVIAWFVMDDSDETDEETETPKKEKKSKPSKEEKQRAKELKKQQKLAAKEAKAQAKENKPKKVKKHKPPKAPKAVKVKAVKEKKVKAVKAVKAKKQPKPKKQKSQASATHRMAANEYEYVTNLVRNCKSVLLASCSREALPVTIPVKVAIQLAMDSKCLLIDLDVRRDAIAKAFELEDTPNPKCLRPMPYKTSFENLFIWPSHNFVRSGHMNIKQLVLAAEAKYDYVLISSPSLNMSPDRKLIAASARKSITFACTENDIGYLRDLIGSRGGNVLANIEIVNEDEEQTFDDLTDNEEEMNLGDPLGLDEGDDNAGLAELEGLIDIEADDDGEVEMESPDVEPEAEMDIEVDLDDLVGEDQDTQIDPDIINDLFNDDDDEDIS